MSLGQFITTSGHSFTPKVVQSTTGAVVARGCQVGIFVAATEGCFGMIWRWSRWIAHELPHDNHKIISLYHMICSLWIIFTNDTCTIWGLYMKTSQLTIHPCSKHISPIRRFARWFLLASSFSFWVIWNNQCMKYVLDKCIHIIYMLLAKKYLHILCSVQTNWLWMCIKQIHGLWQFNPPWATLLWTQSTSDLVIRMMRYENMLLFLFLFAILSYFNMNIDMWCSILNIPALWYSLPHWTSTWPPGLVTDHACCNEYVMTWERRSLWTGTRQQTRHATYRHFAGIDANLVFVGQCVHHLGFLEGHLTEKKVQESLPVKRKLTS